MFLAFEATAVVAPVIPTAVQLSAVKLVADSNADPAPSTYVTLTGVRTAVADTPAKEPVTVAGVAVPPLFPTICITTLLGNEMVWVTTFSPCPPFIASFIVPVTNAPDVPVGVQFTVYEIFAEYDVDELKFVRPENND